MSAPRDWVYGFSEAEIITALEANGWFFSYFDLWYPPGDMNYNGCSLREAFECLLRRGNIR